MTYQITATFATAAEAAAALTAIAKAAGAAARPPATPLPNIVAQDTPAPGVAADEKEVKKTAALLDAVAAANDKVEVPASEPAAPVVKIKAEPKADSTVEAPGKPVPSVAPTVEQPTTAVAPASVASSTPAAIQPPAIDYPSLQKAVFALARVDKDACLKVAGEFGVKTFKDLPSDKWGAALAAVNAALEALAVAA